MEHTIIWMDDDYEFMMNAIPSFQDHGFNVVPCTTVASALQELIRGITKNLLLDIAFPGNEKEGLIFLSQVLEILPDTRVILYTGNGGVSEAVASVKHLNAIDYIEKGSIAGEGKLKEFFQKLHNGFVEGGYKNENPWASKFDKIKLALEQNNIKRFVELLKSIFAKLAYNIKTHESYYHSLIIMMLDIAGMKVDAEVETNQGRIDAVMETKKYIYLMEFKLTDEEIALEQIKERKYFERYLSCPQKKILVGIAFDKKTKNIKNHSTEEMI